MMRVLLALLSLSVAGVSILNDFTKPSPSSNLCLRGLCRFDQLYSKVDSEGASSANLEALLSEDPSNPSAWCTYAELLTQRGNTERARAAFARAVALGPGMSPVLMRSANFDFSHGQIDDGLALSKRIVAQTNAFDELVFSYLMRSGYPMPEMLEAALPVDRRVAGTWLAWLKENGTDQDLVDAWSWMTKHRLSDQASALEFTWTLFNRRRFALARQLWSGWLGPGQKDESSPERLFNLRFEDAPNSGPFDWTLEAPSSVGISRGGGISRGDGLDIRFSGVENVSFSGVHQFATVSAGRYRFSAEIEAHGLTTDQRPVFHVFDVEPARKLDVESQPVAATAGRSWVTVDFTVPPGTEAVEVELERHASEKFDNRIAGSLHVYQVSLRRLRSSF